MVAERTSSGPSAGQSSVVNRHSSILFDLCPHDIALAVLLFGTPVATRANSSGSSVEYEVRFEDDVLLSGHAEWCKPPHLRRFEVAGIKSMTDDAGSTPDVRNSPLGRQCLDFIECCRTRRQPLSNGRLGLTVIRCISALAGSCADSSAWIQVSDVVHHPSSFVNHSEPGRTEHHAEVA
jgi:predicted dehydrogenase